MTTATGAVLPTGTLTCLADVDLPAAIFPATGTAVFADLLMTGLAIGFTADLTGAASFFAGLLATGLATTFFLTALALTPTCLPETVLDTDFFTDAGLTATFLTAALLDTLGFFDGDDLATTFLLAGFATGLWVTDFLAAGFLTGTCFTAGFFSAVFFTTTLAAGLAATRPVVAGFLLALFTGRPLLTTAFGLPALSMTVAAEVLLFCALTAFELRVVFAISLHH